MIKIIIILFSLGCFGQVFKNDNIYIIGSGSVAKQYLIANDFNLKHKYLTHILIGYVSNGKLILFEINPDKGINSYIHQTDWVDFSSQFNNYIGIWEYKTNSLTIKKLEKIIKNKIIQKTTYNFNFDLNLNNQEYCSQFVANCLNELIDFKFKSTVKKLNNKYKSLLKKNEIEYFPVDFFLSDPRFSQIYEFKN